MPDRDVSTLFDVMGYQYAKIIACSAFGCTNGLEAKKKHYGFIKNTFRDLSSGKKTWSDIEREDWQLVESDKECAYCGDTTSLAREHIVPGSLLSMIVVLCAIRSSRYTTKYGRAEDVTLRREQKDFTHSSKTVFQRKRSFLIIFLPLLRRNISRLFINALRDALSVLTQAILTVMVNSQFSILILR